MRLDGIPRFEEGAFDGYIADHCRYFHYQNEANLQMLKHIYTGPCQQGIEEWQPPIEKEGQEVTVPKLYMSGSKLKRAYAKKLAAKERFYLEPRNAFLRGLEGSYSLSEEDGLEEFIFKYPILNLSSVQDQISMPTLYNIWKNLGINRPKFSRWLVKTGVPEKTVAQFFEKLAKESNSYSMELSCRHKDIFRMSNTRHFTSCLKEGNGHDDSKMWHALNSNMALLYKKDAKGDMIWRITVFSIVSDEKPALLLTNEHGNVDKSKVAVILEKLLNIPVLTHTNYPGYPGLSPDKIRKGYSYGASDYDSTRQRTVYRA